MTRPKQFFLSSSEGSESLPSDAAFSVGVLETMRAQGGTIPLLAGHMARLTRSVAPAPPILEKIHTQAIAIARQTADWPQGARVRLRYGVLEDKEIWDFAVVPLESVSPWARGVALTLCRTRVTEEASLSPFVTGATGGDFAGPRNGPEQDSARGCKLLQRDVYRRAEEELSRLSKGLHSGLFHEGLLQDSAGHVIEGLRSNLLVWRNGHWRTPSLRSCGVRGVMLEWLAGRVKIREDELLIADIEQAEELAVCNAVRGVVPVVQLLLKPQAPSRTSRVLSIGQATRNVQALIADALW